MEKYRLIRLFDFIGAEFDNNSRTFLNHCRQMALVCRACFGAEEIKGRVILDAGCGTGAACVYFATGGAGSVYGVDLSRGSLDVAERASSALRLGNISLAKADIASLPFAAETFDIVFSCGVLAYAKNVFGAIDELARVCKKDGRLVLLLLKKTRLDGFYEFIRRVLCRMPASWAGRISSILAFLARPAANIFLKRQGACGVGKPLQQTMLEAFFSPVRLKRQEPAQVVEFLEGRGFKARQINEITGVDFYSPHNAFVVKAVHNAQ